MTEIPDGIPADIWKAALSICDHYKLNAIPIARALLSERERATKEERERCEGIADKWASSYCVGDDEWDAGAYAASEKIATAIRSGARP